MLAPLKRPENISVIILITRDDDSSEYRAQLVEDFIPINWDKWLVANRSEIETLFYQRVCRSFKDAYVFDSMDIVSIYANDLASEHAQIYGVTPTVEVLSFDKEFYEGP